MIVDIRNTELGTGLVVVLDLPLPPKELHPNSLACWQARQRAKIAWQEKIGLAVLAARASSRHPLKRLKAAAVSLRFFFRDRRGLASDRDNLIAHMKYGFDALVKAGLLTDDHGLLHTGVDRCVDRLHPHVEVTLREVTL